MPLHLVIWAGSRSKTRRGPTCMFQQIRFAPALGTHERKLSRRCDICTWTLILMARPSSLDSRTQIEFPKPTAIISTSPNKYQVLWRVKGFDFVRQESTLKLLALAFGGDPACTDCNRVLRVPGFLNLKYDPAHRIASPISRRQHFECR